MHISNSLFFVHGRLLLTALNIPVPVQVISLTYAPTLYLRIALYSLLVKWFVYTEQDMESPEQEPRRLAGASGIINNSSVNLQAH
jgi:hypothetical protein